MTTVNQNVVHWAGDNLIMRFTIKDAAGNPVDLTGATAMWWLAKNANSRVAPNILIKKSSADSSQITFDHVSTFWRVIVRLVPADTENVAPNPNYYHECQIVDAASLVSTAAIGKFKLNPTIIPDP